MSSQCSFGFEFAPLTAQVALDAIFLIVFCVILIVWVIVRITKIRRNSVLKWYLYGIALIFTILYVHLSGCRVYLAKFSYRGTLLDLISGVLSACEVIVNRRERQIGLTESWFYWISS